MNTAKTIDSNMTDDELSDRTLNALPSTPAFTRLRNRASAFCAEISCVACGREIKNTSKATKVTYKSRESVGFVLFGTKCAKLVPAILGRGN